MNIEWNDMVVFDVVIDQDPFRRHWKQSVTTPTNTSTNKRHRRRYRLQKKRAKWLKEKQNKTKSQPLKETEQNTDRKNQLDQLWELTRFQAVN